MRAITAAWTLVLLLPALAFAERGPFELPWSDEPPRIEGELVRVAAVAGPDERIGRFAPRRASARRTANARALAMLHDWANAALAPLRVDPRVAQAVHDAIDANALVEGVRPLSDGGAVVVVVVPLEVLRRACAVEGVPWVR